MEKIIAGLIAAFVSLTVAILSHLASRKALRAQRENLEREMQRKLTEKLYDLRLKYYPKAFEITDQLRGEYLFKGLVLAKDLNVIREELMEWNKSKAGFILSESSIASYYEIRDSLAQNSTNDEGLSKPQIKKIWHAKNKFRGCLRSDLNLLYVEENEDHYI